MIGRLLELLETPKRADELARFLDASPAAVEGMLGLLHSRGYVGHAYDDSPTCGTSCGRCNVQRLCPGGAAEAPALAVLWRVTARGRRAAGQGGGL